MRTRRALILGTAAWTVAPWVVHAAAAPSYTARTHRLPKPPSLAVLTMGGQARRLDRELAVTDAPLVLNFVFTTCSTVCSMQTAVLSQVQRTMSKARRPLRLASITIDPDNDTPEQLRRFAASFGVAQGWEFYTGHFDDLLKVQKHFDVYRGSKAAHPPVLWLHASPSAPWLRVEGFPTADELFTLLRDLPLEG